MTAFRDRKTDEQRLANLEVENAFLRLKVKLETIRATKLQDTLREQMGGSQAYLDEIRRITLHEQYLLAQERHTVAA